MRWVLRNWVPKVLSIIAAFILWTIVLLNQARIAVFPANIPIEYLNLNDGYAVASDANSIKVKIFVEPDVWKSLKAQDFKAQVDFKNLIPGIYQLKITPKIKVENVSIVEVIPREATFTIEPKISKEVDVKVKLIGEPEKNFAVDEIEVSPQKVSIAGAKSVVDNYSEARVVLNINNDRKAKEINLPVELINNLGEPDKSLLITPREVKVNISFTKIANSKSVPIKLAIVNQLNSNQVIKSISIDPPIVDISGEPVEITKIESIKTRPVDLAEISRSQELELELEIPNNITLPETQRQVKVKIELDQVSFIKNYTLPINFTNSPQNLKIDVISSVNAIISLEGNLSSHQSFNPNFVRMTIDLSKVIKGVNNIDINSNIISGIPPELKIISISPEKTVVNAL